jgi:Rieske Fe-S protein
MSTAVIATLAGVTLTEGSPVWLPVHEAPGAAAGSSERIFPMPVADGVTIDRQAQVIVVRFQHNVYAFNLACPHENTALRWQATEGRFQCPRHESKYQPDGTFLSGRATRNMDRLGVRRAGDQLVVDLNRFLRSDQEPKEWMLAVVPA